MTVLRYEELHRRVWSDPESVWEELRTLLCSPTTDPYLDDELHADLIEDLMFHHAPAFIDRLEQLAVECPEIRGTIATAHVGGVALNRGLERFYALQERLMDELEAEQALVTETQPGD